MRFSIERKFVYLANPKTGSTSVRRILDDLSDHQELIDRGMFHEHWSAIQFKQVFEKMGWKWSDFYVFSTIRNPWEKYVSNYYFSKPDHRFKPFYDPEYDEKTMFFHSFKAWLKYYLIELERFPPGCPPLKTFAYSNNNVCLLDDIFKIETFADKALPKLKRIIDIPQDVTLPKLNTTRRNEYSEHYDEETKGLVANACSTDIEIGGYRFESK